MATLDDKLMGEKLHYYCSSSEDEEEEPPQRSWKEGERDKYLKSLGISIKN